MDKLIPDFQTSLFDGFSDILVDYCDWGIDSVLQDSPLKDIPIVRTIVNAGKFAQNVRDRNLVRQTLVFITEFNKGEVSSKKLEKYKEKLRNKPERLEEELGRVLLLLDRNIDKIKTEFEAKLYVSYVNGQITWDMFCELCDITDRLFISDLSKLKEAYNNDGVTEQMPISYMYDRLISVGLLTNEERLSDNFNGIDEDKDEQQYIIRVTEIGRKFCNIVFG